MKNKGILIVAVLVVVVIAAYYFLKGKGTAAGNATVTQTRESTTGVAALFGTGAITSLFSGFGNAANSVGNAVNSATGTTNPPNISTPNPTASAHTEWEEQFFKDNGYYPG